MNPEERKVAHDKHLLDHAIMLLWDLYLDDKSRTQILSFMEDADPEAWLEEVQAGADIRETEDSMRGPL